MRKKILVLLLALMMAIPCFCKVTEKVSAFASLTYEGDEYVYDELFVVDGVTNASNYRATLNSNESTGEATVKKIEYKDDGEYQWIDITFICTKAGEAVFDYEYYDESKTTWKYVDEDCPTISVFIYPVVEVGKTTTIKFEGNLNTTNPDGDSYRDIIPVDSNIIEIVGEPVEDGEFVVVTVRGKAVGTTELTGWAYDAEVPEWYDMSEWDMEIEDSFVKVVAASTSDYLDLDNDDEKYSDKKNIDQNYTLIQDGDTVYTDVTKVKVEWTLPNISATYTSNKTWNPDTLSWDEKKTTADLGEKTATFTFTNYSSVAVGAKVSFSKAIGTESTPFVSNVLTLQSILDPNTHEQIYSEVSGSIKHVYTPNASDFNSLDAGTGKYGTYTITIVGAVKVDFDLNGQDGTIDSQYVGIGGLVKAVTNPVADGYTFGGWYTDAACSLGNEWNFNTSTVSKATTLYANWLVK